MRLSPRFLVLMLTMVTLPLAISLSTTKSARAADDAITQTLEDANQSLGGDFVLDADSSVLSRERQGTYTNGDPVTITDYLSIKSETPNTYCQSYPGEFWKPYSFHGRDGCRLRYGDHPANVIWEVPFASQSRGDNLVLDAGSIVDECYCYVQHPNEGNKVSSDSINALPMAEALNKAAIKNGLYEPMPGEVLPSPSQPGPAVSGQPGRTTDQSVPADAGELPGIPWPIVLGSLGIPVLGALAGATVSGVAGAVPGLEVAAEGWTARNLPSLVELFPFDVRMEGFKADMQKIDDAIGREKKYVLNTWQGYPLIDGASSTLNYIGDAVEADDNWERSRLGMPEEKASEGWTCHDFVTYAHPQVEAAAKAHFPGSTVTKRRLVEQSTLDYESGYAGPLDTLDAVVGGDQGHIFNKLETKNGSTEVVRGIDFWSHIVNDVPIVRPYDEVTAPYQNAVGVGGELEDILYVPKPSKPIRPIGPKSFRRGK